MKPIDIFITSWRRLDMTDRVIKTIHERTKSGTFKIHVLDNESTPKTRDHLARLQDDGLIESMLCHKTNTRCLWGKAVFHSMVSSDQPYYVVTDNDILPPKLGEKDWLMHMVEIMDKNPDLALLTPQLPPQILQSPERLAEDLIYCKAVGNTFKMIRREAYPYGLYPQDMDAFSDDGLVSKLVKENGYKVAFCRDIYCMHLGQTHNWGYAEEDLKDDPRKSGYGKPFEYEVIDEDMFIPKDPKLRM